MFGVFGFAVAFPLILVWMLAFSGYFHRIEWKFPYFNLSVDTLAGKEGFPLIADASSLNRFVLVAHPVPVEEDRGDTFAACPLAEADAAAGILTGEAQRQHPRQQHLLQASPLPSAPLPCGGKSSPKAARMAHWLRSAPAWQTLHVLLPVLLVRYVLFATLGLLFCYLAVQPVFMLLAVVSIILGIGNLLIGELPGLRCALAKSRPWGGPIQTNDHACASPRPPQPHLPPTHTHPHAHLAPFFLY